MNSTLSNIKTYFLKLVVPPTEERVKSTVTNVLSSLNGATISEDDLQQIVHKHYRINPASKFDGLVHTTAVQNSYVKLYGHFYKNNTFVSK